MYARVTRLEASPDRLDAMSQQFQSDIVPLLQGLDGFNGYVLLGDRTKGTAIAVTYWQSEEAMRASEDAVATSRQQAADTAGASSPPAVDRFEVVAQG